MTKHKPVLLKESVDYLITSKSGKYFDATLGFGGHSEEILNRLNKNGRLIATDKDVEAFKFAREKFSADKRIEIYNASFTEIKTIARIEFIDKFDGILADLGVSSFQLDNPDSGFTYREEAPLDLRMDKNSDLTAKDILNNYEEEAIEDILRNYGEEKAARKIAKKIVELRKTQKFETTLQLRDAVAQIVPPNYLKKSLSRIFQALRIAVNNELDELKEFITDAVDLLKPGGRIVILSYHSLEDRIVKEAFKYEALSCICPPEAPVCTCDKESRLKILTKKPVVPSEEEIKVNFRARSAKLRAAERK
jgi:16S rRNA (cytosine1402-N4)-methyltransferase